MNERTEYATRQGRCDHCGRHKLVEVEYIVRKYKDHDDWEPVRALCFKCQQN